MFGWWYQPEKEMLGIVYLFLSAEGRISDADYALFEELGKSIDGFSEMKGEIVEKCEEVLVQAAGGTTIPASVAGTLRHAVAEGAEVQAGQTVAITESILKLNFEIESTAAGKIRFLVPAGTHVAAQQPVAEIGGEGDTRYHAVAGLFSSLKSSGGAGNKNKDILWTLVRLTYQMKASSKKHQELLGIWAEANQIDKSIVLEMCDTCETQNAISGYKKWLEESNDLLYQEVNSRMLELDKDLKSLEQSVSDLIALGKPIGG